MVRYLRLLGKCLQEFRQTYRFILYVDVLKAHISPVVLRVASAVNIWICVIPGKMTWALQPCDTHLFARYKRLLAEEFQRRSGLTPTGEISWELMLDSLWHVIIALLQGQDWSHAFESVGLAKSQARISKRTASKLGYEFNPPPADASLPAFADFEQVFPKGVTVPIHELFLPIERFLRGEIACSVDLMDEDSAGEPAQARPANPWYGRTRSTSAQVESPASSAPAPPRPWTPPQPKSPPPLPPPKEPPTLSATAASSSHCPPQPFPHRRLPMGRRLPAPRRSSSRLESSDAPAESLPPGDAAQL